MSKRIALFQNYFITKKNSYYPCFRTQQCTNLSFPAKVNLSNSLQPSILSLYPLNMSESLSFTEIFIGQRNETLGYNGIYYYYYYYYCYYYFTIIIIIIIIISAVNKNQIYSTYPMFIFVKVAFGGHCLHFQDYTINSMI